RLDRDLQHRPLQRLVRIRHDLDAVHADAQRRHPDHVVLLVDRHIELPDRRGPPHPRRGFRPAPPPAGAGPPGPGYRPPHPLPPPPRRPAPRPPAPRTPRGAARPPRAASPPPPHATCC